MSSKSIDSKKPTISDVRTKGQVWTPRWVADGMAEYLSLSLPGKVLDPAVGPGALLASIRDLNLGRIEYSAYEIDKTVLASHHTPDSFASSQIKSLICRSFLTESSENLVDAVIANPPYLRHHLIPAELKNKCKAICETTLGLSIDARAGIHVYFLVKALSHLAKNGRLAFLVPADTFEGVFASPLWTAIANKYAIDGILTFGSESAAFPGVDTNAAVVFISNRSPSENMVWMKWSGAPNISLASYIRKVFRDGKVRSDKYMTIESVDIRNAILRGMTREQMAPAVDGVPFTSIATSLRGIATGSNEFFLMTRSQIESRNLDLEHFVRTVARVRDVNSDVLTQKDLDKLDMEGRPTFLLSLDKSSKMTKHLKRYLDLGIELGVSDGALVKSRSSWYFMEKREPVPILFCYLGRRNQRFIHTKCDVRPTTGFLCVYPKEGIKANLLHKALNHGSTLEQLSLVGKSYGDGAIKVEPGGMRKLVVPYEALDFAGIKAKR